MRHIITVGAFAALSLTAFDATAQTATQFDLVCSGTRQMALDGPVEEHEYRIRVELDESRWCWDDCERTYPIVEAAPDRLVLSRDSSNTARKRSTSENSVSRVTGEHHLIWIETRPVPTYMEIKGACEAGPFTGFPAAKF